MSRRKFLRVLRQLIERLERTSRLDPRQAKDARSTLRTLERAWRKNDPRALKRALDGIAAVFVVGEPQPPE